MAPRTALRPWTPADCDHLATLLSEGRDYATAAEAMGRTFDSVRLKARTLALGPIQRARAGLAPLVPLAPAAPVGTIDAAPAASGEGALRVETTAHTAALDGGPSARITSLEALLDAAQVDRGAWAVDRHVINKWDVGAKHPQTGAIITEPLWQVKAWLARRAGPSDAEQIAALVAGAVASRAPRARGPIRTLAPSDVLQAVFVADPHLAKYAYDRATGHGDYDLAIARRELLRGAGYLLDAGAQRRVRERVLGFLGDYFHYDTPAGTTTGGTALDRDSRAEKMLEVGAQTACELIAESAETAHTRVLLVPGNHDEVLTAALRLILRAEFRRHPNVVIADDTRRRQYLAWGRNLLGFNHGDKRKKELAASMAIERPVEWGQSTYREIHTGHLHSEGERYEGTLTHAGVIVRTHRSIAPADQWHADEQYIGAPRGMSAWYYHRDGGLVGCDVADPRLLATAAA